ncbi:hypothetical protein [uncultured Rothia sp.]|uniref:hypothetical protein n=1 Tax=uncultured Rothia sp. TaxID=316088 RepID=UPI00321655FF
MDKLQNIPRFSANYTLDPFVDYMVDENHSFYCFRDRFSSELVQRYEEWCYFFLENFSGQEYGFKNEQQRAWFDREYIEIFNEFRQLGLIFQIDLWW